jgi:hypothetical protein
VCAHIALTCTDVSLAASMNVQVADWPTHKRACAAAVKTITMREERVLARPDLGGFQADLMAFINDITSEVTLLAMRSGWALGKPSQCSTTSVLRLRFDYDGGAATDLRQRFSFTRSELVSFEEGLAHLSPETNAHHAALVKATRSTRTHTARDHAMATIVFIGVNSKTGRCWPHRESAVGVTPWSQR